MATLDDAQALARALVDVANGAGCRTVALVTDMNEPLATAAGNALEVATAARFLRGDVIDGRLWDVTVGLGGEALALGGLAATPAEGAERMAEAFASGRAAERFERMVAALGGPSDFLDRFESHLAGAPEIAEVTAGRDGFVGGIDTRGARPGGGRARRRASAGERRHRPRGRAREPARARRDRRARHAARAHPRRRPRRAERRRRRGCGPPTASRRRRRRSGR